jgi:site-specific DNA-methyltransferase (adenine-specific)
MGIDITYLAVALMKNRLQDSFGDDAKYEIIGEPKDESSAKALAQHDRYQFQWWALSLIKARPYQGKKKGADEGIDGLIYFQDVDPAQPKTAVTQKIIVQVKSGKVGVKDIRELKSVVESQGAVIGVFITLQSPTQPMETEAVKAGVFQRFSAKYPKIQIRTIQALLEGRGIAYPQTNIDVTFKKATRHEKEGKQLELI